MGSVPSGAPMPLQQGFDADSPLSRNVLEFSNDCVKVIDADGRLMFMNVNGLCVMEIDDFNAIKNKPWPTLWPEKEQAKIAQSITDALEKGVAHLVAQCPTAKGNWKWWDVTVTAIPAENGKPQRLISVSRDITAQKEAEDDLRASHDRLTVVSSEMKHRISNAFMLMQTIVSQSARSSTDTKDFADKLNGRISAMAGANHAILAGANSRAKLRAVIDGQLGGFHGDASRIDISGPDVELSASAATSIALVLHELATNAMKHGALTGHSGRVTLMWSVAERDGKPALDMVWRESGGPPVTTPTRRGFGSVLIDRGLSGGKVERTFAPDGVLCTMTLPL